LGKILKENNYSTLIGDEGGYSPSLKSNSEAFELIIKAVNASGYKLTIDVDLAIDVAASEFYENGSYKFKKEERNLKSDELINYYLDLKSEYPIYSFEDPFSEDDWQGFKNFTQKLEEMNKSSSLVVGDDLYTTNPSRIKHGIEEKTTNAVLIKPNQIGTVLETVQAIKITKKAGLKTVISNRSGETEDSFIADLAYGSAADFLKTGSISRSERLCKYNRLIEIETYG
jgi:enolase